MRILLTEDDAALAEALQFALTQSGYAVDWVSNGAAADEALKQDIFGLLILDIGLPKLDGFEVLRRLRRHNATLPVLILSGREQSEEKVTGLDLGADDYLVKPFQPQ
jgi:two-component system response regulator QseB